MEQGVVAQGVYIRTPKEKQHEFSYDIPDSWNKPCIYLFI